MTTQIASRWVKAAFLVVLGVVILVYSGKFVDDLRTALEGNVSFTWTWDLLTILLWILVAWLFVDAALIVALSFTEYAYTLADVMHRLQRIEKKLGIPQPKAELKPNEPVKEEEVVPEEPPPPKE